MKLIELNIIENIDNSFLYILIEKPLQKQWFFFTLEFVFYGDYMRNLRIEIATVELIKNYY